MTAITIPSNEIDPTSKEKNGYADISQQSDDKIKIMNSDYGGWAYQILLGKRVFISQHYIPAINNLKGFQSEEDARKVAKLVVKRIENSEFPTISLIDLHDLNIAI